MAYPNQWDETQVGKNKYVAHDGESIILVIGSTLSVVEGGSVVSVQEYERFSYARKAAQRIATKISTGEDATSVRRHMESQTGNGLKSVNGNAVGNNGNGNSKK